MAKRNRFTKIGYDAARKAGLGDVVDALADLDTALSEARSEAEAGAAAYWEVSEIFALRGVLARQFSDEETWLKMAGERVDFLDAIMSRWLEGALCARSALVLALLRAGRSDDARAEFARATLLANLLEPTSPDLSNPNSDYRIAERAVDHARNFGPFVG